MRFSKVNPKQSFPKLEEEILAYWQKEKIFEQSLKQDSPQGEFKFFDGPPFATGLPHYGHILQGVIKDLIPRYKTMQGYRVPRVWGWDCHGLPVENLIEKDLGLKSKQDVEKYGVDKFNEKCRESVLKYAEEWKKTVARMGRWIDMENAYKTMDLEYMDSVWWVFGELWKKDLIYEGLKPMHICPRCETPLSNFEVGLGYKDITDLSATAKFELIEPASVNPRVHSEESKTYLLAWTTTPWTLIGNVALAVGEDIEYVKVKIKKPHRLAKPNKKMEDEIAKGITQEISATEAEYVILAKEIFEKAKKNFKHPLCRKLKDSEKLETFSGAELIKKYKSYKPLFPYYADKDPYENVPGLYFVTFNTENSVPIFEDEELRDACAEAFREVAKKHKYEIFDLAVMPDHVHLTINIEEGGDSLPRTLQQLKWFSSWKLKAQDPELTPQISGGLTLKESENLTTKIDKKTGEEYTKLWRKGYDKKFIYSDEEYLNISDYIRKNPEKKNLSPQSYDWLTTYDDVNQPIKPPPPVPFRIVAGDFVTTEDGTGIVHIAPAFGEDDHEIAKKENLPVIQHISMDGKFVDETGEFAGLEVKPADDPRKTDQKIVDWLKEQGKLFSSENIKHSYPHCWRCETPLLNYATSSWFVKVEEIKKDLLASNEKINWVPAHIREGRFGKWLEGARDWAISRNRFWGSPLPIWRCEKCNETKCVSSKKELEKLSDTTVKDLHKHFVDKIEIECDCGEKMQRIPEVLDCWFESGSMPYASQYVVSSNQPTEKNKKTSANCQLKTKNCTADFIGEAQDQTRGWFYTLHVLANALAKKAAFHNCTCTGLVLAEDGEKMSKSKQNFPPPQKIFDNYGADAMRLYLMQSPVTHAEDLRFSERGVEETLRSVLLPLWNTFYFFTTYANADGWEPTEGDIRECRLQPKNKLDKWILSELNLLIKEMTEALEKYEIQKAVQPLAKFLDGLTNWYIRRSRRRFWKSENDEDKNEAYVTLQHVLTEVSKLLAPITPFLAEKIYRDLTGGDSVHLESWPEVDEGKIDETLSGEVDITRKIISLGLAIRAREKIKVRQPLAKATIALPVKTKLEEEIIREELNVKKIEITKDPASIATQSIEVNARIVGKKLGSKVQELIKLSREGKFEITKDGVKIGDEVLSGDEVKVGFKGKAGEAVESDDGIVVAFDTKITPELKLEGQARDLVRVIQDLRKKADYDVSDRIELQLEGAEEILKTHEKYIAAETLAEKISQKVDSPDAEDYLDKIKIGVKKL